MFYKIVKFLRCLVFFSYNVRLQVINISGEIIDIIRQQDFSGGRGGER